MIASRAVEGLRDEPTFKRVRDHPDGRVSRRFQEPMRSSSIRTNLTRSLGGILVLLMVVSASAIAGLVTIESHLETIHRKWLVGSQLLGALSNAVSQFRIAEGYRALVADEPSATQADFLANKHAASVEKLLGDYEHLAQNDPMSDDVRDVKESWRDYLGRHRAWVSSEQATVPSKPAGYGSALQRSYEAVQLATENLIEDAKVAANAEAQAADRSAWIATVLVTLLSAAAGLLTIALMVLIDLRITRPLRGITTALTRLAGGQGDVQVPEVDRHDEIGAMATAFEVFRANAVALGEAQERAEALARHDVLTALPNRRFFASDLDVCLGKAADSSFACAVMLIDLDRFKPVNDLHGHAVGDMVLCEISTRLRSLVGQNGSVARLGGDEFAIITPMAANRVAAAEAAIQLASRVVAVVGESVKSDQMAIKVGASIGIALCPSDGDSSEALLRAADLAMYRAKHDGRGTFRFFEGSMDEQLRARAALERDLQLAVNNDEITPNFQPLVALDSDRIAGFEALARWHHPERGWIAPDTFIPLAEQLGLLPALTASILRQATRHARHWGSEIGLAVNISPGQFQDPGFPTMLAGILLAEGFAPHRLEIEVTETALIGDLQSAKFTLDALQQLGVKVVLDDFGTGYSSLSRLCELKFDKIKIDRSFIQSMNDNAESRTIVDAVLGLARNLGMPAVAEGIEDGDVKGLLASRGCAFGQGYFFSRAVPADQALAMLTATAQERADTAAAGEAAA